MELNFRQTAQLTGVLLLLAALTQIIYTVLHSSGADVPRQLLWGSEGVLFVIMAALAGSALVQSSAQQLAWSAITAAAVLNVVQVGVGLTLFAPFFKAAGSVEALAPVAGAIVALQLFLYVRDFIARGQFRETDVASEMMRPYGRIVLLHIGIFVGFGVMLLLGQPMLGILGLILLRALWGMYQSYKRRIQPARESADKVDEPSPI